MASSYKVKPPSISGRLGEGFGKGLAEQLPKEIERGRLSYGLQQLEKESGNLDPLQTFTRALGIPGVMDRPELLRNFTELLRQKQKSQIGSNQENLTTKQIQPSKAPEGKPTISRKEAREEALNPTLPMSQEQKRERARQIQSETNLPWDESLNEAEKENNSAIQRGSALRGAFETQNAIENDIKGHLKGIKERYNVNVPAKVYGDIESEAIKSILPEEEGGQGLSYEQAIKEYGPKLDLASRNYKDIETLSHKNPKDMIRRTESLQKDFASRDDTDNYANELITQMKISPGLAFSIAQPINAIPDLNKVIKKIPYIDPRIAASENKATKYFPELLESMGNKGSPQAIAHELEEKGYDPKHWLRYVKEHNEKLTGLQNDQINKQIDLFNPLEDSWYKFWRKFK